jgi:hypothetical protein
VHRVAARHGAWALWLPVAHGRRVVGACDRAPAGTGALVAVPFLLRRIATASRLKTASLHVRQPGAPARNHIQLQRAGAPAPAWNRHRSFSSGSIGGGRGVARTTSTPPLPSSGERRVPSLTTAFRKPARPVAKPAVGRPGLNPPLPLILH